MDVCPRCGHKLYGGVCIHCGWRSKEEPVLPNEGAMDDDLAVSAAALAWAEICHG